MSSPEDSPPSTSASDAGTPSAKASATGTAPNASSANAEGGGERERTDTPSADEGAGHDERTPKPGRSRRLLRRLRGLRPDPRSLAHWIIAAVAAGAYIAYSAFQWRDFAVPSWDLGIFSELAKQYGGLHAPTVDIKGPGFNLLGDHFHPLLVLLGPVYWLFPSGLTLLVVQDLLFAASAVPIMRLASARLGDHLGAAVGVSYLMSWGLWSAVESQFHEIAFAVPLISYSLCSWIESEGRSRSAIVSMAALVFVKEDLGLTVAAFGLVVIWIEWGRTTREGDFDLYVRSLTSLMATLRSRTARIGAGLAAWGILWTLLAITVILPAIHPGGTWEYTDRLSQTDTMTTGPFTRLIFPTVKLQTLGLLALAAGVIGAVSPYMWIMVPTLAWRFLGNVDFYWGWHWHYSAILVPMAVVALVDSAHKRRRIRGAAALAVAVSLCSNLAVAWTSTIDQFFDRQPHALTARQRTAAEGAVAIAGSGHRVVASLRLLAYLVPDNRVFWEGTAKGADVDVVAVDPASAASSSGEAADKWAEERFGGRWRIVYLKEGYQVAVRIE